MQRGRVRSACVRCRRQKLKCDPHPPCQLCVRSGVECEPLTHLWSDHAQERPAAGKRKASDTLHRGTAKTRLVHHQPAVGSPAQVEYLSTFRLVEQIFAVHDKTWKAGDTSCAGRNLVRRIPDPDSVSIHDILGHELPATPIVDFLVDSFFHATHWFLPLLDEPIFRARLDALVKANACSQSDRPFLMLALVVFLIGLHFAPVEDLEKLTPQVDVPALRGGLTASLEKHFLDSLGECNLDWVSFTCLLGVYYLLNRRLRQASIVLNSAIRAAQDLRLDKAMDRVTMSTVDREIHKRVWWFLYVGDGLAALLSGGARIIRSEDVSVSEPFDIDDNSAISGVFRSSERREDGSLKPVTVYSFHRYRIKFYRIASRLNPRKSRHEGDVDDTRDIYEKLDQLRTSLPPELQLDSYTNRNHDSGESPTSRTFRLQALNLRVICEHIQLLLFRPYIAFKQPDSTALQPENTPDDRSDMMSLGRSRCFESAMRIARIDQHTDILRMAAKTPLVMHLGVLSFTSGTLLGMLALLDPTSNHARECQMGLARIIKLPSKCSFRNPLWDQATDMLKRILRLVGSEEIETLLLGGFPRSPVSSAEESPITTSNCGTGGDDTTQNEYLTNATELANLEALTQYHTAFADLYGSSMGLEDDTWSTTVVEQDSHSGTDGTCRQVHSSPFDDNLLGTTAWAGSTSDQQTPSDSEILSWGSLDDATSFHYGL